MQNSDLTVIFDLDGTIYQTMYANSEDFQVLAIITMVSSFVAEWYDQIVKVTNGRDNQYPT